MRIVGRRGGHWILSGFHCGDSFAWGLERCEKVVMILRLVCTVYCNYSIEMNRTPF
jgi:hypothetical protein